MKVVLFCGGLGLRLREYKDFVLCPGDKADVVKRYFLDNDETLSNDFVLSGSGRRVDLLGRDIKLVSYAHEGFWAPMDTVKERQALEAMYDSGRPPWAVWQREPSRASA